MAPSKTSAAAALNKRKFPSLTKYVKHGIFCFICLAAGFVCVAVIRNEQVTTAASPAAPVLIPPPGPDAPPKVVTADSLPYADDLLASGDPANAMEIYRHFDANLPKGDPIRYRKALCEEHLGNIDNAVQAYGTIIETSPQAGFVNAARVGLVRTLILSRDWNAAIDLLHSMALSAGERNEPTGTVLHRLAQVAAMQTVAENVTPYEDTGILSPDWTENIERMLRLPATFAANKSAETINEDSNKYNSGITVLSAIQNDPATIYVSVNVDDASVSPLIDDLLSKANLQSHWDTKPTQFMQRRVRVDVAEMDLATVLDSLLQPLGMTWIGDGQVVRIVSMREMDPALRKQMLATQAERYAHNALALFPDHATAVQTYFSLGNLSFTSGDYERATNYYRQIIQTSRRSEVLGDTWFNTAKALRQMNRAEEALDAFIKVVDYARGRDIEAVAYLYLGELQIESGNVDEAVKYLVRAVSIAKQPDVRQLVAVTLASAYLLEDNPLAANMTLMDQRDILTSSPHHGNSWFLSSLARFRAAKNETERFHRGRTLTASLTEVTPEYFFTSAGVVLLGQAYAEIGLPNEMQSIYQTFVQGAKSNVARMRALLALGDSYVESGQVDHGLDLYELLTQEKSGDWAEQARLRIAEINLSAGRNDDCLANCVQLVGETKSPDVKSRALVLMGQVYQSQADHYKAAICFAGMIPHVSTAEAQSGQFAK